MKYGWFAGTQAPSWALDMAGCWMNNPRDMIELQNAIWEKHAAWSSGQVPIVTYGDDAASNRPFWGWNEVPVDRVTVVNQNNWDAVLIKLPIAACGGNGRDDRLHCFDSIHNLAYSKQLENSLNDWVKYNYLTDGAEMVIVREYMEGHLEYLREFFCESWKSPTGRFEIVYERNSRCYLKDNGESLAI